METSCEGSGVFGVGTERVNGQKKETHRSRNPAGGLVVGDGNITKSSVFHHEFTSFFDRRFHQVTRGILNGSIDASKNFTDGRCKVSVIEGIFVRCLYTPNITFLPSFKSIRHDYFPKIKNKSSIQ